MQGKTSIRGPKQRKSHRVIPPYENVLNREKRSQRWLKPVLDMRNDVCKVRKEADPHTSNQPETILGLYSDAKLFSSFEVVQVIDFELVQVIQIHRRQLSSKRETHCSYHC